MKRGKMLKAAAGVFAGILAIASLTINFGLVFGNPVTDAGPELKAASPAPGSAAKRGDEQLAYLLVKLELQTRKEMAGHYTRTQSSIPGINKLYQRILAKNRVLPAAVADRIFSDTVPQATGGRAWVKMVVDEPRNPNNRADETAHSLLEELRQGALTAQRQTAGAYYYAEPIKAKAACMFCHGQPKGAPDPFFSEYTKDGWSEGDIIGAVVARVAPEESVGQ